MIKIYFVSIYVFVLHPQFLAHSSWNFLSEGSHIGVFCYVNEVDFRPHLGTGGGCQETQPGRGLNFQPHLLTPREEKGAGG